MKNYPKKLFHLLVFILTLLHASSAFSEEIPFKLSYGETEDKLRTQINFDAGIPERAMLKTISLVSLKKGLIIKDISVNQGNLLFLNRAMPLPVSLKYGQKYNAYLTVDMSQQRSPRETLNMLTSFHLQDFQVIDIAVSLGDGRTFIFEVGDDSLYLIDVKQNTTKQSTPPSPPIQEPTTTQSVQEPASTQSEQQHESAPLIMDKPESLFDKIKSFFASEQSNPESVEKGILEKFIDTIKAFLAKCLAPFSSFFSDEQVQQAVADTDTVKEKTPATTNYITKEETSNPELHDITEGATFVIPKDFEGSVKDMSDGDLEYYEILQPAATLRIYDRDRLSNATLECLNTALYTDSIVKITGDFKEDTLSYSLATTTPKKVQCKIIEVGSVPNKIHFTEKKHNDFLQDEQYSLASDMLNETWKLIKANTDKAQYEQILWGQRQWLREGRDTAASLYAHVGMSQVKAFSMAIKNRAEMLSRIIAIQPKNAGYESRHGGFSVTVQGNTISVNDGNTLNDRGNLCSFYGKGVIRKGWMTITNEDSLPPFYLLMTQSGAKIAYSASSTSYACGANAYFDYEYTLLKEQQ